MKNIFFIRLIVVFTIMLISFNCKVPQYAILSDNANNMIVIKAKDLIDKSTDTYSTHAMEIANLKVQVDSIVVEENNRKMNQATIAMWSIVQKDKFSLYGFFDLWQQQNTVSPAAVAEMNQKLLSILNIIQTWEQRKKGGPLFNK